MITLIAVKEDAEFHQLIMSFRSLLFGLFLKWEKIVNLFTDFYYVCNFHLLNPCNQKDKQVFHSKICMCEQA